MRPFYGFTMRHVLSLIALLVAAMAMPAAAQEYPAPPPGAILDSADLLPADQEAELDLRLQQYNQATGRAIIVVTMASTDGWDIDLYTRDLAEQWGIGGAETEEGAILLIAVEDRQMAIKTARGVQDRLTDISSGQIIRNTLRPAFRQGDFAGGITAAVGQIIQRLDMAPADARAIAEAEAAAESKRQSDGGFPIGTLIWLGFLFFFFILPMMRGGGRRRRYRSGVGGAVGDIMLWEAGKAISRSSGWGGGGSSFGGGSSGGGFGGFGGGGGGFNGGGASGGW